MKEVEVKDGMMQLDHRKVTRGLGHAFGESTALRDCGVPYCPESLAVTTNVLSRRGKQLLADITLWKNDQDLGKMTLRWVADTKDPLFSRLSRYERQILYLYYSQEQSWKDIARTCRKAIKTIQDDYLKILEKIRSRAGVPGPEPLEDAG